MARGLGVWAPHPPAEAGVSAGLTPLPARLCLAAHSRCPSVPDPGDSQNAPRAGQGPAGP